MWTYEIPEAAGLLSALKKLGRGYPQETEELFSRLQSLVDMLNDGLSLPQVRSRGWVHDKYKHGVLSIDAGGGKGRAKLRLYVLPDNERIVVLVVGAGKKDTQGKDVKSAYELVKMLSGE